jgi:3-hydroxyisobutyrate dehydrogenase-like beta-hydroxyacid dehydrogenase/uncharacterized protein YgbK (DUF1537 family)
MISFDDLVQGYPTAERVPAAAIAERVAASGRVLVVLDDDPTGTQSVADLPVLTGWSTDDLAWALRTGKPAVYVMTNSRSLDPVDAGVRNREVVIAALQASRDTGVAVDFVSRSDSTLRGHFPLETDTIAACLAERSGRTVDAVVIVPAFGEAGRLTVGGVHYAGTASSGFVPVGETEFARDATFGYASSDLREWVEEKTEGRHRAADVVALTLDVLRAGPEAVAQVLSTLTGAAPVVVDCVEENDLRILALGLDLAERAGKDLLYRVGPPFVRARIGQEVHAPLTAQDVARIHAAGRGRPTAGGLVVVGSHMALTTRQLAVLRERRAPAEVEISVADVLDPVRRDAHLATVVRTVVDGLARGNVVIGTSRTLVTGEDGASSLDIARRVSTAVIEVVQAVLAARPPRFVVAKGGITSSDVATRGLGIRRAVVRGPMLPGIVSLWEPSDGPARGIPFIVFAGNVGGDESLADVVDTLSYTPQDRIHGGTMTDISTPAALSTTTIAVLGLGAMGLPMATCLAPHAVVRAYDPTPERTALAAERGVKAAASAREAARGADVVLLAVRNYAQLDSALFGDDGVAAVLEPGAVILLTSTVGIEPVRQVAAQLAEAGLHLVDAPVSGGPVRAGNGTLLITVGATDEAFDKVAPVLEVLAGTLKRMGPRPGDGQAMKTVNQLLCGVHIAAGAEALALARALGLDPAAALETLGAGAAESFMLGDRGPRMLQAYDDGGAEVRSRLDIFVKDMGIVTGAAKAVHLATPVAAAAEQLFLLGEARGLAASDDSAVITVLAPSLDA